jgi:cytochrome b561
VNTYSFPRYGSARITLHWLMALLMVAVYALIELREFYPKGSDPRELMKTLHFMLGLGVLFLAVLRIFVATQSPKPPITPALSAWQRILAAITHGLLYLLMLGLPLLGWLLLSAAGKPIPFFGIELPPLIGQDKALAKTLKEVHQLAGQAGYFLIGLHTAAALFHHYVVKDDTLRRMLPCVCRTKN